jgi:RNA polymerase sigma-70 factor, ECF subfamily
MTVALLETWLGAGLDAPDGSSVPGELRRKPSGPVPEGTVDDHTLLQRIRHGDSLAFDTLALRHIPALVRFAAAIVGDRDSAEDVVQIVLARLWERRIDVTPTGSVIAYLCAMVRNQALDLRRRNDVHARASVAAGTGMNAAAPIPGDLDENDEIRTLRIAFFKLPEHYRTALQLRYGQQLGYADIAGALTLTVKGAERLLARALAALRRNMGVE